MFKMPEDEIRQKILNKEAKDPKLQQGYKIISIDSYTKKRTIIEYKRSTVSAYVLVDNNPWKISNWKLINTSLSTKMSEKLK